MDRTIYLVIFAILLIDVVLSSEKTPSKRLSYLWELVYFYGSCHLLVGDMLLGCGVFICIWYVV